MIHQSVQFSLNIGGRLRTWTHPIVAGILNVTPDSFYAGSRVAADSVLAKAGGMLEAGAEILDIGGYSTRPGASDISPEEETARLIPAIREIRKEFPEAIISVDTFRTDVARAAIEAGADIINDIGGATLDEMMLPTVAELKVPYILSHTRGTPATMQQLTDYDDVVADVLKALAFQCDRFHQAGVCDIIIDPGFGFAKTTEQNFRLLDNLALFTRLGPVMAGVSRKSMITRTLGITPDKALNGTTALNMAALINGAAILRVHDVKEAVETVKLYQALTAGRDDTRRVITTTFADRSTSTDIY